MAQKLMRGCRARTAGRGPCGAIESLEARRLLSVSLPALAHGGNHGHAALHQPLHHRLGRAHPTLHVTTSATSGPSGYTPQQIRTAYGFDQIAFSNGRAGDGSGQTIAIVDAYDDPNIASDLATFDAQFGLAAPPSFVKATPQGRPKANAGWDLEIALDVQWAHAVAPAANILLVEARTNSFSNLLDSVNYAAQNGASVISMSWGGNEFSSEASYDSYFQQAGVSYVASAGDSGGVVEYPAASPQVLSVGGTTLALNSDNTWAGETGWSDSGGGTSAYEAKPSYQSALNNYATRATPDVGYDADPSSGVAVYDSVRYDGHAGWFEVGGTSAGSPQWAGLLAIANQGRALAGKAVLNSIAGQTLAAVYSLPSGSLHDVTGGTAGSNTAGAGYDLITGNGTPLADQVVNSLVSA